MFNFILTFLWNIFVNNHLKIMSVCDVLKKVSVQRIPREFCVCKTIKGTNVFRTLENEYYFNNYYNDEIIPCFNNSHMLHLKLELITKYTICMDRGTIIWDYSFNFVRISVYILFITIYCIYLCCSLFSWLDYLTILILLDFCLFINSSFPALIYSYGFYSYICTFINTTLSFSYSLLTFY